MNSKLILFDIDGTLLYHVHTHRFEDQYEFAMKEVFGIALTFDLARFNGTIDRHNSWEMVKDHGISRKEFLEKFPRYIQVMHDVLSTRGHDQTLYIEIPSAVSLVKKLHGDSGVTLGVITGNARSIARWKLEHIGLDAYFPFGLYGDEADDRIELAGKVFEKAKLELHTVFVPGDIIVVGDTVYDIRCGKAIGAYTIAVMTGMHADRSVLAAEKPDMLVDTLLDPAVLSLFSMG